MNERTRRFGPEDRFIQSTRFSMISRITWPGPSCWIISFHQTQWFDKNTTQFWGFSWRLKIDIFDKSVRCCSVALFEEPLHIFLASLWNEFNLILQFVKIDNAQTGAKTQNEMNEEEFNSNSESIRAQKFFLDENWKKLPWSPTHPCPDLMWAFRIDLIL